MRKGIESIGRTRRLLGAVRVCRGDKRVFSTPRAVLRCWCHGVAAPVRGARPRGGLDSAARASRTSSSSLRSSLREWMATRSSKRPHGQAGRGKTSPATGVRRAAGPSQSYPWRALMLPILLDFRQSRRNQVTHKRNVYLPINRNLE